MEVYLYVIESWNYAWGEKKEWEVDPEAPVFGTLEAAKTYLKEEGRGNMQYDDWYSEPYVVIDTENYRIIRITVPVTDREEVVL